MLGEHERGRDDHDPVRQLQSDHEVPLRIDRPVSAVRGLQRSLNKWYPLKKIYLEGVSLHTLFHF